MKFTEQIVLTIINEARANGVKRAQEKLAQLTAQGPAFAVVENAKGDILSDPSKPERIVDTLLDVCGFANLHISARGAFYTIAKRLSSGPKEAMYRFHCRRGYYGGGSLSIFDCTNRQEMGVNEAAMQGCKEVLAKYGIEARVESRID